jgi:catechol 2,3-dioxygenase-like lactoylglutathione lyase family enzyme
VKPRIHLITLGVSDIKRSREFYEKGLGFKASSASQDDVAFYHMDGTVLALYPRATLAEDAQVKNDGQGFDGVTLDQNGHLVLPK